MMTIRTPGGIVHACRSVQSGVRTLYGRRASVVGEGTRLGERETEYTVVGPYDPTTNARPVLGRAIVSEA